MPSDFQALAKPFAGKMADTATQVLLRHLKADQIDLDLLAKILKSQSEAALREGWNDAKMAIDNGMPMWAEATYLASAGKAGVEAAKVYLQKVGVEVA